MQHNWSLPVKWSYISIELIIPNIFYELRLIDGEVEGSLDVDDLGGSLYAVDLGGSLYAVDLGGSLYAVDLGVTDLIANE